MKKKLFLSLSILSSLLLCGSVGCSNNVTSSVISSEESSSKEEISSSVSPSSSESTSSSSTSESTSSSSTSVSLKEKYNALSVLDAINLTKNQSADFESEDVYVYGIIKTVSNSTYGEMTLTDGTNDLYVFGVYDFSTLDDKPTKGDEIVLQGKVKIYNSQVELGKSNLIEFNHISQDVSDEYVSMNIESARNASKDSLVKVKGIVSSITYADKLVPNGFYISDDTSSIYVYDKDAASNVKVGNEIEIAGTKTYYVSSSEASNASKYNYKGSNQIQNCILISNDNGNHDFDTSWIEQKSVKDIMDNDPSNDITNKYFKVNALIKKVEGSGFVNYYIDDFDGTTGSYVYTMNSGSDYSYLDTYDGKACTLILTPINAKSSSTGCSYRFEVIKVLDDDYKFDTSKIAQFALDYYCDDLFESTYTSDPSIECVTSVSNTYIPFDGVSISYTSSNEDVGYFVSEDDKLIFHTKNVGSTTITLTSTYGEQSATKTYNVEVKEKVNYETKSVKQAIDAENNTEVYVKGIVGPSLVNKVGFYLIDETGTIAVLMSSSDEMAKVNFGDEVILKGERQTYVKSSVTGVAGQSEIYNATVEENNYGNHTYSTASFINDKTLSDVASLDAATDYTTQVYSLTATIAYEETNYYTRYALTSGDSRIQLYSSNANQYSFLSDYKNQEVEMEIALCNFNSKTYYTAVCLSITVDGNKIYNKLNFSNK